jgi:hypothetical protein
VKTLPLLIACAALLPGALLAAEAPSCSKAAAADYVKLPPLSSKCDADPRLGCNVDDKPSAADRLRCEALASAYAKVLQRKLPASWWSVPAEQLESCRQQKESAQPEAPGEGIMGSERVRLLLADSGCEGGGGQHDVVLAVKSDQGLKIKVLEVGYYDPHEDAPFSLEVIRNGADTLALVSGHGHDNQEQYTTTVAYKVDLASGNIAEYPLYLTDGHPGSLLENSEPTLNFDEDESSSEVQDGKLAGRFVQYTYLKDCPEDGDCVVNEVVTKRVFTWNGSAFVAGGAAAAPPPAMQADHRELAAHRACLKARFDPKTGAADCPGDFADNCESNNDLSFLNYKAGNLDRARDYAAKALEECKNDPKQLAAAQYNERRARGK